QTVADLRSKSELFFDVHLMLDNPHLYVKAFAEAGAELISIHVEPDYDVAGTLEEIRSLGVKTGVVFNPKTSVSAVEPFLNEVELVLAMTVQPGFGGQSFDESVLEKIAQLDALRQERGLDYRIEVDGGINTSTAARCREAGADTFVAGTAFFKSPDLTAFRKAIEEPS
ncbi:MAG: ribulose-phosphate 3-epimerase, partial [Cyanobacteria bacterium P01_F01_bin.42]